MTESSYYTSKYSTTQDRPDCDYYVMTMVDEHGRSIRNENYIEDKIMSYDESTYIELEFFTLSIQKFYKLTNPRSEKGSDFELISIKYIQSALNSDMEIENVYNGDNAYMSTNYCFYNKNKQLVRLIRHDSGQFPPNDIRYILDDNGDVKFETWFNADGSIQKQFAE